MAQGTQDHLLVVDDDRRLRDLLTQFLTTHGFHVDAAEDGQQALEKIAARAYGLIILDEMMPNLTGLEMLRKLRQMPAPYTHIPVLMLTAKAELDHRLDGFDAGVDDYLAKPFEPLELLARIRAILRRAPSHNTMSLIHFGPLIFNIETGQLTHADQVVHLSSTEVELLRMMALQAHQPIPREELAKRSGFIISERSVDVQITRLRRKLGDDPRQPRYLQTIRHQGYALCPD